MKNPDAGHGSDAGELGTETAAEFVLHGERLVIGTERVPTERVRFTKRIVTATRTVEVPVRVEQLVVTHEPLPAGSTIPEGGSAPELVIVLHEEVPEVTLRVVPVERVSVAVRTVTGEQAVSAELATEVVDVTRS